MSGTCFTCAIKWQCPSRSRSTFKTWLWLCVPLLSSCSTGNSSPGSFPHISLLALPCGARVLQSRKWPYTEDIHPSGCVGWEDHLFSLMITGSKYLEDFSFATVPMPGNAPTPAVVEFHSSASGVFSDSGNTLNILGITRAWLRGFSATWRSGCCAALTLSKALCSVSEHSSILKLRCWKAEIARTVWVIQIR